MPLPSPPLSSATDGLRCSRAVVFADLLLAGERRAVVVVEPRVDAGAGVVGRLPGDHENVLVERIGVDSGKGQRRIALVAGDLLVDPGLDAFGNAAAVQLADENPAAVAVRAFPGHQVAAGFVGSAHLGILLVARAGQAELDIAAERRAVVREKPAPDPPAVAVAGLPGYQEGGRLPKKPPRAGSRRRHFQAPGSRRSPACRPARRPGNRRWCRFAFRPLPGDHEPAAVADRNRRLDRLGRCRRQPAWRRRPRRRRHRRPGSRTTKPSPSSSRLCQTATKPPSAVLATSGADWSPSTMSGTQHVVAQGERRLVGPRREADHGENRQNCENKWCNEQVLHPIRNVAEDFSQADRAIA